MAGTVVADTFKSGTTLPPVFVNTNGTEVGTLCRAWVNFNGTGTVAIRASFNVSSITDGGVGLYTVNFTNAMPDANYAICGSGNDLVSYLIVATTNLYTSGVSIRLTSASTTGDNQQVHVAVFR